MANWPPSPDQNRPPSQHVVVSEDMAGRVLDAYKSNPMLSALFVTNVVMFLGFGYYLIVKDEKVASYITMLETNLRDLRLEAVRMAGECRHTPQYVLPPVQIPAAPQPVAPPAPTPPKRPIK